LVELSIATHELSNTEGTCLLRRECVAAHTEFAYRARGRRFDRQFDWEELQFYGCANSLSTSPVGGRVSAALAGEAERTHIQTYVVTAPGGDTVVLRTSRAAVTA
jgi:hypothetical protein